MPAKPPCDKYPDLSPRRLNWRSGPTNMEPRVRGREITEYTLFVAAPTDTDSEHDAIRRAVCRINTSRLQKNSQLIVKTWRDVPSRPGDPQKITNVHISHADLVVMLFNRRFGSRTKDFSSGSLEEFELAQRLWKKQRSPDLKLYFRGYQAESEALDSQADRKRVEAFMQYVIEQRRMMFHIYTSAADFDERIDRELRLWLEEQETERLGPLGIVRGTGAGKGASAVPGADAVRRPGELIGRDGNLAAARRTLLDPAVRVLALAGRSGIGKTALASALIADLGDAFPGGLVRIGLLEDDLKPLVQRIAEAVGLSRASPARLEERLLSWFADRRALVALENFERAPASAALVARFLATTQAVKFLVTTRVRIPLDATEVRDQWLGPLSCPTPAEIAAGTLSGKYGSTALFLKRAREISPQFAMQPGDDLVVARICSLLEGHPLSIELRAGRAGIYGASDILADLLRERANPDGDAAAPAGSLANLTWATRQLSESELRFFHRLAIFAGGFDTAAARAVRSGQAGDERVEALLQRLLACHLVVRQEGAPTRFALQERVLEFAHAGLSASDDFERVVAAHTRHFAGLARSREEALRGPGRQEALDALAIDHDNLDIALQRLRATPAQFALGLQLASDLFWFWNFRGLFDEGRQHALALLESTQASLGSTREWGRAARTAGGLLFMEGEIGAAEQWLRRSVTVLDGAAVDARTDVDLAYALVILGRATRDFAEAVELEGRSVEIFRAAGDRWGLALALNDLGYVLIAHSRPEEGRRAYEQSIEMWRALEDPWGLPLALSNLGFCACYRAEGAATARAALEEALAIQLDACDAWGVAETLKYLAELDRQAGDLGEAERRVRESLRLHVDLGRRQLMVDGLFGLARVLAGNAVGAPPRWRAAAVLFAAGQRHLEEGGYPLPLLERQLNDPLVVRVQREMPPADFDAACAAGRGLELFQACRMALTDPLYARSIPADA